ncbi:hypothetical protein AAMO2058_001534700 [Amorphochlora amoebiformis]|uniref:AP complex subunit sigma n=1 Tax=Amorphochlora amoebiformis TaxID=1561963 RepID=A0A7S0CW85_9EUKA
MIEAILIINNYGQARLARFYNKPAFAEQKKIIQECFQLLSKRSDRVCNFLEGSSSWGKNVKLIYRHYATLYFVFAVDASESELGVLDLIQVFVEALDKCFENVCELDLIFYADKVNYILDEIVMGGMVLETSLKQILHAVNGNLQAKKATRGRARSQKPHVLKRQ